MAKGFNHAIQLAVSAAAAVGRLFGLEPDAIAEAIAIAGRVAPGAGGRAPTS